MLSQEIQMRVQVVMVKVLQARLWDKQIVIQWHFLIPKLHMESQWSSALVWKRPDLDFIHKFIGHCTSPSSQ